MCSKYKEPINQSAIKAIETFYIDEFLSKINKYRLYRKYDILFFLIYFHTDKQKTMSLLDNKKLFDVIQNLFHFLQSNRGKKIYKQLCNTYSHFTIAIEPEFIQFLNKKQILFFIQNTRCSASFVKEVVTTMSHIDIDIEVSFAKDNIINFLDTYYTREDLPILIDFIINNIYIFYSPSILKNAYCQKLIPLIISHILKADDFLMEEGKEIFNQLKIVYLL